ncbi:ribosomal protein L6 [Aedoeadaptatus coxii]|uniref:Large ribosomal subunit protein uL6 n=1 Tax=Aedoeadaptatus coxii TaxID=755172 RepID=A0A134ACB4_9FIRM|nr:50S ribosomal protein L6 [Peptoniphilus coxii]KXB65347.1 ribosomal protein L6 [Peptoniphilus coxii]CAC9925054.1 ribosomal protein L6 [Peptoniphilus coxii]
MSRIGKNPIDIPSGVEVKMNGNVVEVKGPKGSLKTEFNPIINIAIEDNQVIVTRPNDNKDVRALHGLYRTLIANNIEGVLNGYEKKLEIIGTGYRAQKQGKKLNMNLGHSHPIELEDPEGIEVEVPSNTEITVKGIDKQKVGAYAAKIRSFRSPEPYKGKGIRYVGEYVRRKVGKTGK